MESFNIVLSWDKPDCKSPVELTREITTDYLMKANEYAFDIIKKNFVRDIGQDPMVMPLLVSALGHDWVFSTHN
jgi:hypothetical protein